MGDSEHMGLKMPPSKRRLRHLLRDAVDLFEGDPYPNGLVL